MEKHCEKCVKENIGCKEIQHLFRDVDKLKASKKFNTFLYIFITVISVGFVIVSILVWHNMLKQSISTANFKPEELKSMADLFNSQFSNLLIVLGLLLTIFGVAIPIVNAIYQKQTLKDERESLRREIDVSLANLEAQEKKLEDKIESAKEEREKQIAKVRSDLANSIRKAEKHFQYQFAEFEKERFNSDGYFLLQLALSNRKDVRLFSVYCSYAAVCYSVYAENNDHFAERFYFVVERLKLKLSECYTQDDFDSEMVKNNLQDAKKNVREDSVYWHKLHELINIIEELDKKKLQIKNLSPWQSKMKTNPFS